MLPVQVKLHEICKMIDSHPVCAIEASTGSGKTTMLPPGYLEHNGGMVRILVLEPTVVAARRSADRISCLYPSIKLGTGAGGKHNYDQNCEIVFMTYGHAQIVFGRDKTFRNFDVVMFDEVHVCSTELELLTLMVQHAPIRNFKVVLLSATLLNNTTISWMDLYKNMPVFDLVALIFPIEITFGSQDFKMDKDGQRLLAQSTLDYLAWANVNSEPGHFLVFCSGMDMIDDLYDKLFSDEHAPKFENCYVYCAHSSMPDHELDAAFSQVEPIDNRRSIILSTDIGETSVTIPYVVRVVDLGLQKIMICLDEVSVLKTVQVSKFAAKQRAGRTGRTGPGAVHRMYTIACFEQLDECYEPAIARTPLHQTVLNLVSFKYDPEQILQKYVEPARVRACMRSLCDQSLILEDHKQNLYLSQEGRTICFWPLGLNLARVLYLLQSHEDEATRLVGTLAVVIAQIESGLSLPYIPRRERDESVYDHQMRVMEHRQKYDRFEEFSCCPLNSSVLAFRCFVLETHEMTRSNQIAWTTENGLNNKTLGEISVLFNRLHKSPPCFPDACDVSRIFEQNVIPIFQTRFPKCYTETKIDKWSCVEEPNVLYRLNSRGFGFDTSYATPRVLCIHASHSMKPGTVSRTIVVYVYLN
jgi:HrpA-like RNA helicase